MKNQLLYLLFVILFSTVSGQNKTEKMLGSWYMYNGNHILTERLSVATGLQIRTYEALDNYNLSLGYIGLKFKPKKNISLGLRYGYLEIDRSIEFLEQPNAIEHRIMGDITYAALFKKHRLIQRFQLESRFIHFIESNIVQNRVRYRLEYRYPITKWLTVNTSNEFFFHQRGISYRENRFYSGIFIKTSNATKLQIGFMRHFINDLYLNRLQIGIVLNTDFR